jgi:hypothetical protein
MTDRSTRVTALTAAAKAKSAAKTKDAERGIRALIKREEPVTFQAVQREAGVSHSFLYGNPELRKRIEHLRARSQPNSPPPTPPDPDNGLLLALTGQITHLKKEHRHRVDALQAALEQAHGENLNLRRELARLGGPRQAQPNHADSISPTR